MQRAWIQKEETSSTNAYLENMMLASVIYTKEDGDIATIYIPNFFIQTPIYRRPGEDKIITKIKGVLVDMLVPVDPEKYGLSVVYEKVKNLLYLNVLKAIYGMIK